LVVARIAMGLAPTLAEAERLISQPGQEMSWGLLRRFAAGRDGLDADLAGLARWFDDGSFSRWVTSELPSVADLLAMLDGRLTPDARRRITQHVSFPGLLAE
jgi:hypothetical protein